MADAIPRRNLTDTSLTMNKFPDLIIIACWMAGKLNLEMVLERKSPDGDVMMTQACLVLLRRSRAGSSFI